MNIFVIPSWYPAASDPLQGIFFKEQALYLAQHYPHLRIGVSVWGQGEEDLFLSRKQWQQAPGKVLKSWLHQEQRKLLLPNLVEYHCPTLQWTNLILSGNIQGILRANRRNLKRFRVKFGPVSLIHAHVSYPAGFLAMRLSEEFGIPYVITEHMGPFPFPSLLNRARNLKSCVAVPLQKASRTIAVSKALAIQMNNYGLSGMEVIPNVVDEQFFYPGDFLNEASATVHFFTLASISAEKGIGNLLHAIKLVVLGNKKVHFRIGGEGPERQGFMEMANHLGLSPFISWLGVLDRQEAVAEFQRADAFVLPSRWESFGLVYAEALACGVPVIATKCGGPEDMVHPGNGILVAAGDVAGLAQEILSFSRGSTQYDPEVIRQDFLARFSKEAVLPQILRVYEEVAGAVIGRAG